MQTCKKVNLLGQMHPISVTYGISYAEPVLKTERAMNEQASLPKSITLIYASSGLTADSKPSPISSDTCQLYVGCQPVPSDRWSYDADSGLLSFHAFSHSGQFYLTNTSVESHGIISNQSGAFSASIIINPLTYELDIAKDAAYIAEIGTQPVLKYDENSQKWKDAWSVNRQEKKLRLSYHLEGTPVVGQTVYNLSMQYESPDEDIWIPTSGSYGALIDGNFNISFDLNPDTEASKDYELYPCRLLGKLDPFGQILTGAILTGENSAKGTAYGIIGHYVNETSICGAYKLTDKTHAFCVLGGKLHINGIRIDNSHVNGSELSWDFSCEDNLTEYTDALPQKGTLYFSPDGSMITGQQLDGQLLQNNQQLGLRISPEELVSMTPSLLAGDHLLKEDSHPTYAKLLAMSQYQTDEKGVLHDMIQDKAMDDFLTLLKHYIPADLYKQFINLNLDDLPQDLQGIFQMKGDDGTEASKAYIPYTTAYLTSLLSTASQDPYSGKLNAVRADKYIKNNLATNKVYQNQAPAIYRLEWLKQFPDMQTYITDQEESAEYYATMIASDCEHWKTEAASSFDTSDPDSLKALTDYQNHINKIADKAANEGRYWAYFLLRYTMTPTFLAILQSASLGGTIDPVSEITKKVQQISALISILDPDPNSIFVQEFMQMIQIFQLSNVIPMLFDLSGDSSLADYSYSVTKIMQEFAEKYKDSTDETLKNYASYISSLSAEDFKRLYMCMGCAYNSLDGLFVYSKFVSSFDKWYQRLFGKLPELSAYSVMIASTVSGIIMFASGQISWKDLRTLEQVKLIGTGVGLFSAVAMKITQRAILVNLLKPEMGFWKRVGTFFRFSDANKIKALSDPTIINSRFKKWFVGEAGLGKSSLEEIAANARALGHTEEASGFSMGKIFGRNLDVNLVRGLGITFAIAGIVFSSIAVHNDTSSLETASDALFLASSCIDLIAISADIAGFEATSAAFGVFGVAVVLAGFIVLMIYLNKPKATPIEEFAKNQADQAGFYMPYGYDIDSFAIIPPSGQLPSQTGISVYAGSLDKSVTFHADGTVSVGAFDGKAATCLGLDVDADGNVRFFTFIKHADQKYIPMYLAADDKGKIVVTKFSDKASDRSQIWKCSATGSFTRSDNQHLQNAVFTISPEKNPNQYLSLDSNGTGLTLSSTATSWTISMQTAAAEGLHMSDITLHTFDRDRAFFPHLDIQGSNPKVFSISPSLPDFMEFQPSTGRITQKQGIAPTVTAETSYKLSLTDALGTQVSPVTFSFQVTEGSSL